jgi:hypothetical protein
MALPRLWHEFMFFDGTTKHYSESLPHHPDVIISSFGNFRANSEFSDQIAVFFLMERSFSIHPAGAFSHLCPKCSSPSPQRSSILSPETFKGLSVFVQSPDPDEAPTVCHALEHIGAIVRPSSETAAIVLSPARLPPPESPAPSRSRAARLVEAATEGNPVRTVHFSQIPSFRAIFRNSNRSQPRRKVPPELKVVVADSRGQLEPRALDLTEVPRLHFGAVPRGYSRSPFDVIEEGVAESESGKVRLGQVPAVGTCGLCRETYADPVAHQKSVAHRWAAGHCWDDFDLIAAAMCTGKDAFVTH